MALLPRIQNKLALYDTTQSAKLRLGQAVASFTFDDFPISAYSIAGKMLEEAGARATYFASAEFMGRTMDGIDYYTPELLREMVAAGHEIGCHSFAHTHLAAKGGPHARVMAEMNAQAMRDVLGEQFMMTSFAYPYGDVSVSVKHAMARQFALSRGVRRGLNTGSADLAQLRVVSLEARHWNSDELATTIQQAVATRSWIVFLTHDISAAPTPYGSTPEMVHTALRMVMEAKIEILPLKAAVGRAVFGESGGL